MSTMHSTLPQQQDLAQQWAGVIITPGSEIRLLPVPDWLCGKDIKNAVFCAVTPHSLVEISRRFDGTDYFHLQSQELV